MAIDTERERDQGIGRNYSYPPIKRGHCYVNQEKRPERMGGPERDDIGLLNLRATHLINAIIEKYNAERD